MKKLGWLLAALLFANTLSAQFVIDKDKVFDLRTRKDYIVREYPGKTAEQLYNACIETLHTMDPDNPPRYETVENETITINQYSPNQIYSFSFFGRQQSMDIRMLATVRFTNGQVRIDSPSVNSLFYQGGTEDKVKFHFYYFNYEDYLNSSEDATPIYNRRGELKHPRIKQSVEEYLNAYTTRIFNGIQASLD